MTDSVLVLSLVSMTQTRLMLLQLSGFQQRRWSNGYSEVENPKIKSKKRYIEASHKDLALLRIPFYSLHASSRLSLFAMQYFCFIPCTM